MINRSNNDVVLIQEYTGYIRRFQLEQSLAAINRVVAAIVANKEQFRESAIGRAVPRTINLWNMDFLAKSLILHSNDYRSKNLDEQGLLEAAALYNDLGDPFVATNSPTTEDLLSFLLRTAHQQFPAQLAIRYHLGRTKYMFIDIASEVGTGTFDLQGEFEKLSGLSVIEFMVIGFGLFSLSMAHGPFKLPITNYMERLRGYFTEEKINRFLARSMVDYEGFRLAQEHEAVKEGYEKFQLNCLRRFPLIKTQRSQLIIAPDPMMIVHRITKGIFYDLRDNFNKGGKQNEFATFFGKTIFELYVGKLLRKTLPSLTIFSEVDYAGGKKTSDWIVIEGQSAILIECKTSDLTVEAKTFAEQDQLRQDLRKRIVADFGQADRPHG